MDSAQVEVDVADSVQDTLRYPAGNLRGVTGCRAGALKDFRGHGDHLLGTGNVLQRADAIAIALALASMATDESSFIRSELSSVS